MEPSGAVVKETKVVVIETGEDVTKICVVVSHQMMVPILAGQVAGVTDVGGSVASYVTDQR